MHEHIKLVIDNQIKGVQEAQEEVKKVQQASLEDWSLVGVKCFSFFLSFWAVASGVEINKKESEE